jgi:hypothetical protein
VGIKAGEPYFGSWYFHFWKQSSNTFADISMIEHPTQTLYFRLYDAQNNFLEEIKGADNERFHEARPTGDYYIQVLTDANNGHNSNGGNTARLISRFRPAERAPSAQNVEWVSTATSAIYKGAVFSIAARLTSEANVQIPFGVQKICPIGNLEEPSLDHTLDEINIGNLPKGTYSVALAMKNGVHWYPEFAVYKVPGPGEMYQKIVGGTLSHNGGTLTLGVGYYDTVQIPTQGDRYAEYELTLAKQ